MFQVRSTDELDVVLEVGEADGLGAESVQVGEHQGDELLLLLLHLSHPRAQVYLGQPGTPQPGTPKDTEHLGTDPEMESSNLAVRYGISCVRT